MRSNHGTHMLNLWLSQSKTISDTNIVSISETDIHSSYDDWVKATHPWFVVVKGRGKSEVKFQPSFDEDSVKRACQGGYLLGFTKLVIDLFDPGIRSRVFRQSIEPVYQQLSRFWTSESWALRGVLDSYASKE